MKKIGLIGGTSWHSALEYYRLINQQTNDFFGNNTNPPLWMSNLNQQEIHHLQQEGLWNQIAEIILAHAQKLESVGVQALALCANTPHKVVPLIQEKLLVPFLHIADAVRADIHFHGWTKVGLLGTRFTMKEDFLKDRISQKNKIEVIVPEEQTQLVLHRFIAEELSMGIFKASTQEYFLQSIRDLRSQGAQAVILGCTEIPLLLKDIASPIPAMDTLKIHCDYIVRYILEDRIISLSHSA